MMDPILNVISAVNLSMLAATLGIASGITGARIASSYRFNADYLFQIVQRSPFRLIKIILAIQFIHN